MTESALILLGSNIDGKGNLACAVKLLEADPQIVVSAYSSVYFSPSIGPDGHPDGNPPFYNMAAMVLTSFSAEELRESLRLIEAKMGRVRTTDKFAPRPIDLDIEFYGRGIVSIGEESIPKLDATRHPHIALPLAEIAPDWIHPVLELSLSEIALRLSKSEVEKIQS